ncbi:aspartyl-tRNA(Asn)/glutamyl-tRNA(Gln) amidotransferase subunit A [Litorivivens lipolytica]|uniref:Glutamyl-tRNA(Gln) amidotransferase subunit A n=1 Tax=Litorivivens lipolytica TaxID=1524264 RepID=A0A7W4W4Q7_9GAMM|nr:Asp-tRNA(Asn)/Glu-tRNA(Gln) amidotransferase subunit GatA [Litorivivens lipolytica]MBB3047128.1 aspartyl-tRNA(Asn)/glutamyl-tRNA(Gln) amidotransferase subunit A [Litorivivens lipolytica]
MHSKTLRELADGLDSGQFSSEELTRHFLARINEHNPTVNAYITVMEEQAIAQAKAADARRANGKASVLDGIPLAHKDIFCTEGVRTSCASKMLDNFIAPYNATIVEKIATAGMVTLGKTNMDEFAMGSSNETSWYGPVRNPWNTDCVPGGSSGGSAAAVAAGLAPASTGTDTGGSIRQPAALCNLTGLKPTYGLVSRYGMIAFASSLDQAGPMTRTAEDSALLLQAMAGFDEKDSTSLKRDIPDYNATLNDSLEGKVIGVPKEFFAEGLSDEIATKVRDALAEFEKQGATLKEISLPHSHLSIPCYYVIAPAEASTNLSRYDGVRYGHRCENPQDLADLYTRTREEGFGDEVKRRILVGTYALSAGFYDAYYRKAQRIRRLIKQDFIEAFKEVDIIAGPTSPNPAFGIGEKVNDPLTMYLEDMYTIAVNLAGIPGLSIPAGLVDGKPVGLQLIGKDFCEAELLNAAHRFQLATDWHQQTPAAFA